LIEAGKDICSGHDSSRGRQNGFCCPPNPPLQFRWLREPHVISPAQHPALDFLLFGVKPNFAVGTDFTCDASSKCRRELGAR
jgi:hypothetical protein